MDLLLFQVIDKPRTEINRVKILSLLIKNYYSYLRFRRNDSSSNEDALVENLLGKLRNTFY